MGFFFKTKEEKEEIRNQKRVKAEAEREAVRNSPITQIIRDYLREEFTGEGSGNVLSEFRSCEFAILNVYRSGVGITIHHKRKKPDGTSTTPFGILNFESIGYSNLNYNMVDELKKILFEELLGLDCMQVSEISGDLYLHPIKKSW